MRDGFVGCHYALVKQAGGRMSPQSLHVLDETGQLGEFLRDLRLQHCGHPSAAADPFSPPARGQKLRDAVAR